MASSTRRAQSEERTPRTPRAAKPNMLPVFATVGLVVVVALVVTVLTQKSKDKANEVDAAARSGSASVNNPFSDIDTSPEKLMRKSSGSSRPATTNNAPPGLADAQVFQEARVLAGEAKTLVEAALQAEKAGDTETWRTKAIAGRDKLELVMEMTAIWESEINDTWGSNDAQVQKITAEMDTWRKLLNKVRKAR